MHLTVDDFVAGWIGGVCGLVVGHPWDTVKVRQQTYGSSLPTAIRRTYKHEGISGFFKGILLPLLTIGPANAILFGVYGNIIRYFEPKHYTEHKISYHDRTAINHILISGTVGGLAQTVFICPVEMVKTVLQAKTDGKGSWRKHYEVPYTGSFDAFRGILRDRGFRGLYRGITPMLFRDVPTSGIYILTYELLLYSSFSQCKTHPLVKQSIAGGVAGFLSWIFVFPFDVVKSRMQTDNPQKPKYRTMMECFRKSYKEEGHRLFFNGLPITILRTIPVNSTIFVVYEMVLKFLTTDSE